MKIFITADFSKEAIERLKQDGHEVRHGGWGVTHEILTEDELIQELGDSSVLFVGYEPVTRKVIDNSNIKIICSIRGGPKANIDTDYATSQGIPIIFTLGREAIPVADFTMGQIIALVRKIVQTDRELHKGKFTAPSEEYGSDVDVIWDMSEEGPWESRKGIELGGKTLGLIGFGTVGQQVAQRARCFGLKIVAYDPYQKDSAFIKYRAAKVELEELYKQSDIISIHARVTESNKGMLDSKAFSMMKDGVYIVNNARAAIIEEQALRNGLDTGKIAGVALDVFHDEPIKTEDPYFKMDNVVLTPHIAGAGFEVVYRHSDMLVDDFKRLLSGEKPVAIFNPEVLEGFNGKELQSASSGLSTVSTAGNEANPAPPLNYEELVKQATREVIERMDDKVENKNLGNGILTLEEVISIINSGDKVDFNKYKLTSLAEDYIKDLNRQSN